MTVRRTTAEDTAAVQAMSQAAFGGAPGSQPPAPDRPGRHRWGAFDAEGRLLAKLTDIEQGHWYGGRVVPASGVAGVAVAPEARGRGLARELLTRVLHEARDRGAVVSTLFRTAPALYRSLGWEQSGVLTRHTLPTASLAPLRIPPGVTVRSAEDCDVPALCATYTAVARDGAGWLDRVAPRVDVEGLLHRYDGVTVALGDAGVEGWCGWRRGEGYDAEARITVPDLHAVTGRATQALLAVLGTWTSVAPTVVLTVADPDPVWLAVPGSWGRVETVDPWMLRVVDAPGAVEARGWPSWARGVADLQVDDPVLPHNAGPWRLVLDDGQGRLERGGTGAVRLDVRGLALLVGGAATPGLLRRAGLLSGDVASDGLLAAAASGPPPALLDYF